MNVGELIEKLSTLPREMPVIVDEGASMYAEPELYLIDNRSLYLQPSEPTLLISFYLHDEKQI